MCPEGYLETALLHFSFFSHLCLFNSLSHFICTCSALFGSFFFARLLPCGRLINTIRFSSASLGTETGAIQY